MEKLKEDVYLAPQIEIMTFSNLDVITTSGPDQNENSGDVLGNLPDDTWQ